MATSVRSGGVIRPGEADADLASRAARYDANVLYPNTLRDLLIRIGQAGLVQAR